MPNDEAEFEKTLTGLSEDEQNSKRLEFKASKADDYREKLNIQNRILEKEGFEFKDGHWDKKPTTTPEPVALIKSLDSMDAVLIAKSDIAAEDVQTVIDYANFAKKAVKDVMNDATLRTILKTRVEERTTANTTQIKTATRTGQRETPEQIVELARQGQLPESDEGVDSLVAARIEMKRARRQK